MKRLINFLPVLSLGLMASPLPSPAAPTGPALALIEHFRLAKIPVEGCWFTVTYTSAERLPAAALPARYGGPRAAGGAIYALATREDFSALHRLRTDEIWHFYSGDPLELLLLHPDGRAVVFVLGPDVAAGQRPQFTVPAGTWMGGRPQRDDPAAYSFFGTTMAPGFDPADFEPGYRDELQRAFPAARDRIAALTRTEFRTRPPTAAAAPAPAIAPHLVAPGDVPAIAVAPGVELRELVGRVARAGSDRCSVARFALAAGHGTGESYNRVGEEIFLILSGRGTVVVAGESSPVQAGAVVVLRPEVRHSLTAAPDSALEFYAITTPAFSPADYVPVASGP